MRNLLLCFLFVGSTSFTLAQSSHPSGKLKGPVITLNTEDIDYGTIKQGADGDRQFTVKNTGTEPLLLSGCLGSCGCTVPKCDTAPIPPGKTSVVNVHYDTGRPGPFTKTVTVNSNAVNAPTKVVTIHGVVEADNAPHKVQVGQNSDGAGGGGIPPAHGDPREVND